MVDSISDCLDEANRRVHECHTITGGKNVQNCEPKKCPEKEYVHNCVRCYTVVERCETCKAVHKFPPGDPTRGDLYVRSAPIGSWMCPRCGAMELGVNENRDATRQMTLEGFTK